jgi:hypothetical protein
MKKQMYKKGGAKKKGAQALFDKLKGMGYSKMGGSTYGAGDGDMTPGKARMNQMAKGGGLMGYRNGGDVLDPGTMKNGGSIKMKKK